MERVVAPAYQHLQRLRPDHPEHPPSQNSSRNDRWCFSSLAGTSFQALLRNPLADPTCLAFPTEHRWALSWRSSPNPISHFRLYSPRCSLPWEPLSRGSDDHRSLFSGRREGQIDSSTLLLGGVITGSFLSAIIMFLMSTLSGSLRGVSFWLMGDLSTPLQKSVYWFLGIGFIVASGAIYTTASDLNLLLAGEKEATSGVNVAVPSLSTLPHFFTGFSSIPFSPARSKFRSEAVV